MDDRVYVRVRLYPLLKTCEFALPCCLRVGVVRKLMTSELLSVGGAGYLVSPNATLMVLEGTSQGLALGEEELVGELVCSGVLFDSVLLGLV